MGFNQRTLNSTFYPNVCSSMWVAKFRSTDPTIQNVTKHSTTKVNNKEKKTLLSGEFLLATFENKIHLNGNDKSVK